MNNMRWTIVAVAVVFAGAGFWGGMTYAANVAPATSKLPGAGGVTFRTRDGSGGGPFGSATIGTVIKTGNGSFNVQLPNSTSTGATTGTKLVLVSASTQVDELQSVPASNVRVGQTVTVAGSANSDGSITASSIMIRPATARDSGANSSASANPSSTQ